MLSGIRIKAICNPVKGEASRGAGIPPGAKAVRLHVLQDGGQPGSRAHYLLWARSGGQLKDARHRVSIQRRKSRTSLVKER